MGEEKVEFVVQLVRGTQQSALIRQNKFFYVSGINDDSVNKAVLDGS